MTGNTNNQQITENKVIKNGYKKKKIPQALRQQVWLSSCGEVYKAKCRTSWCKNNITIFDFQCGHNIPEVRGGKTTVDNLVPICGRCNQSMGHHFTFDEWCETYRGTKSQQRNVPVVSGEQNVNTGAFNWCCWVCF